MSRPVDLQSQSVLRDPQLLGEDDHAMAPEGDPLRRDPVALRLHLFNVTYAAIHQCLTGQPGPLGERR